MATDVRERQDLYDNETKVLHRIEAVLAAGSEWPAERLFEEYRLLSRHYQSLLRDSRKLVRVGDSTQRRLMNAKEVITRKTEELSQKNEILYHTSVTDHLTGIYNRTYLMENLAREHSRSFRHGLHLSCILIDIDKFKNINDTYGHLIGDVVLRETADRIRKMVREQDIFGRYGGEEFLLILPSTALANAGILAEKIRAQLADEPIRCDNLAMNVTLSCGVAEMIREKNPDIDSLIRFADLAMYLAKNNGRNRVEFFSEELL